MKQTQTEKETVHTEMVELVAGPLCGMMTKWPWPDVEAMIPNGRGGYPRYRLEKASMKGGVTALHVKNT